MEVKGDAIETHFCFIAMMMIQVFTQVVSLPESSVLLDGCL